MMSRTEIRGLSRPAPVVRVACLVHHREQLPAALHGRGSRLRTRCLWSNSADGLRPQYMPAPHQLHSISSTQLHQVHFSCPNLHISNLSLTKPTIPHMHMLCT
ncbi:hypothetical protein DY000_02037531 [Brassica cretica]|uniref:Uncharacterized protein n=1 Tax=Brassica cretica TaxID=69181 RepID=A0ABQ7B6Q6_BRACR|nr:hypothetical protein DY000_02037531 [Brassica cretica]